MISNIQNRSQILCQLDFARVLLILLITISSIQLQIWSRMPHTKSEILFKKNKKNLIFQEKKKKSKNIYIYIFDQNTYIKSKFDEESILIIRKNIRSSFLIKKK